MSYQSDVAYGIWSRGGNPDSVHPDRVDDYRDNGYAADDAAQAICQREQRRHREARQLQDEEQAHYEAMEREHYEAMEREHYEQLAQQEAAELEAAEALGSNVELTGAARYERE